MERDRAKKIEGFGKKKILKMTNKGKTFHKNLLSNYLVINIFKLNK